MAKQQRQSSSFSRDRFEAHADMTGPLILAIGELAQWREGGRLLPADGQIHFADFDEVSAALIEKVQPDVILSPLVAQRFDCIELAQKLAEAGFKGRYRAMAPSIPNPRMIRMEIRALYPKLDFDIVHYSAQAQPRIS